MKKMDVLEEKHMVNPQDLKTILNDNFKELEGRTINMLSKANSLETDIKEIKGDIQVIKGDITAINGRLDIIEKDVNLLKKDVTEMKVAIVWIVDHLKGNSPTQLLTDSKEP